MSGAVKVLIANRGEIAVRILRALHDFGMKGVAVYSEADESAPHVRLADEAYAIGPAPSRESYLNAAKLFEVARRSGCAAVHPGYGFFSENAEFARAVEEAGMTWIGPPWRVIAAMGSKTESRKIAAQAGVPIVPGGTEPLASSAEVEAFGRQHGYPIMLKAVAGGGGKGMRLIERPEDAALAFRAASGEGESFFGDASVYAERAIRRPRHIEIQVLGDGRGNLVHLGERECSLQRRHQKVVEEAPSPIVTPELRQRMGEAALAVARRVGYVSVGTVEFLVENERDFYFLEMNTRLQVEHPVTEMVTGLDLALLMIRIAFGDAIPFSQEEVQWRGHAIECRIYAEDPRRNFFPSPGELTTLELPEGPGVRNDCGVAAGYVVPIHYDPLLAKLTVWGEDRLAAICRMRRALEEYRVLGVETTIPLFRALMDHPDFVSGALDTGLLDRLLAGGWMRRAGSAACEVPEVALLAAAIAYFEDASCPAPGGAVTASRWKQAARQSLLRGCR